MDKRALSSLFRDRLRALMARDEDSIAGFARETGTDRSALSQFLDPAIDRLPRAETLRAIAAAKGVTTDWLLGLSNAPDAGRPLSPSVEIELAEGADGGSPLARWRREAAGAKLRYVPATLPDMLRLPEAMAYEMENPRAAARQEAGEDMLDDAKLGDLDIEIAMPLQTLEDLAQGAGVWRDMSPGLRAAQLLHMGGLCAGHYPALRLHLYDARRTFSAPFTVFGAVRAALYLGRSYVVLTGTEQVRAMARTFDGLVREAVVGPDVADATLADLAEGMRR